MDAVFLASSKKTNFTSLFWCVIDTIAKTPDQKKPVRNPILVTTILKYQ